MTVCAEAADAAHAVQQRSRRMPDICLLDIRMPGGGVAASWEIAARLPTTKIVMLTVSDDDAKPLRRAPCRSRRLPRQRTLTSGSSPPAALRDTAEGRAAIPRSLVARMVKQFHGTDPRFRTTAHRRRGRARAPANQPRVGRARRPWPTACRPERSGRRLQLKPSGVRAHITAIVRKLGVEDRGRGRRFLPRDHRPVAP